MELPKVLSQRNPQWGAFNMGTTTDKIRDYGCLITDIAMMISAFNPDNHPNPGDVNVWLTNNQGYTQGDLVIWGRIQGMDGNIIPQGTSFSGNIEEISDYLRRENTLCIVEVRMNGFMHFVLAYKSYGNGSQTWCVDPWDGVAKPLLNFGKIYSAHFYGDAIPNNPVVPQPVVQPPIPEPPQPPAVSPKPVEVVPIEDLKPLPPEPTETITAEDNANWIANLLRPIIDFILLIISKFKK